jgi:predicted ATP-dependent endonuclease of OLD family
MFSRQDLAKKVIYTTHSIGCLPEDLGFGVRMIEAIDEVEGPKVSRAQNWFWSEARPGFEPLLFGMGARTLAFIPVRYALVAEGISEVLLLPTLLREALGQSYIGFQVVPGLSAAGRSDFARLELGAPRVAYLVDSDAAGRDLERQLTKAGIDKSRIVRLGKGLRAAQTLEDFIDPEVYTKAVSEELRRSYGDRLSFSPQNLSNRAPMVRAVEEFCESNGVKPPSKRAIAYRVLEHRVKTMEGILHRRHRSHLRAIYKEIRSALEVHTRTN